MLKSFIVFYCSFILLSPVLAEEQTIRSSGGDIFMEEVPQAKPKTRKKQPQIMDYSSLGVPVDPEGNIVPLIDKFGGPVRQNFSQTEVYWTPPTVYTPVYPYRQPIWNPYYGYGAYPPMAPAPYYLPTPVYPALPWRAPSTGGLSFSFGSGNSSPSGPFAGNFSWSGSRGYLWLPGQTEIWRTNKVFPSLLGM